VCPTSVRRLFGGVRAARPLHHPGQLGRRQAQRPSRQRRSGRHRCPINNAILLHRRRWRQLQELGEKSRRFSDAGPTSGAGRVEVHRQLAQKGEERPILGGETLGEDGKGVVTAAPGQHDKRPDGEQLNGKVSPQLAREGIEQHAHDLGQGLPGGKGVGQVGRVGGGGVRGRGNAAQAQVGITDGLERGNGAGLAGLGALGEAELQAAAELGPTPETAVNSKRLEI